MKSKKPVKLKRFDVADFLETPEDVAYYLEAAFSDGDPQFIASALEDISRSKGVAKVARKSGIPREDLCKFLRDIGDPSFQAQIDLLRLLGLRVTVANPIE